MKNFKFSMFNDKSKLVKEQSDNIITTEKNSMLSNILSCEMKSPSSTKKRNKIGILKFLVLFSKI